MRSRLWNDGIIPPPPISSTGSRTPATSRTASALVNRFRDPNDPFDWTLRENVCANLRPLARRILRKHGYPPNKQEKAPQTVLEQAELLSAEWVTV